MYDYLVCILDLILVNTVQLLDVYFTVMTNSVKVNNSNTFMITLIRMIFCILTPSGLQVGIA